MKDYWSKRYAEDRTGWDLGAPSPPLKAYFDQLVNRQVKILIPGAGNSYEAEYLHKIGFSNVSVLDITNEPLEAFAARNPTFPKDQLLEEDFFSHENNYDLIIEQTFFCSFPPSPATRHQYAEKMNALLKQDGKLVGLWFNIPLKGDMEKRPFGGNKEEYLEYLSPHFEVQSFEECYNSVAPRANTELFGIFKKK